jgi:hypothetical protein
MFRVAKPGGRFTISDIVADQPVPQYLVHDSEKWGDCLSGALTLTEYIAGMVGAGFLGIHLIKASPWQVIDGIHFFSVTLTGYKLPTNMPQSDVRYATLCGPFSRVVDELGTTYFRGIPQPITPDALCLLSQAPLASHFVMFAGPFVEAADDDQHVYRRGEPLEICSKTLNVLEADGYAPHFAIINRAGQRVSGDAVICSPNEGCC